MHSRFVATPPIKAKLAILSASVLSRVKKSTAHAPTASHWTLPTLPLGGAGVDYAIFNILARVLYFANAGVKSCSDLMVCMQANKFSETRFCWKPKAEFRASLTQSGPKLTLGLVDVHNNERGVRKRASQHLSLNPFLSESNRNGL